MSRDRIVLKRDWDFVSAISTRDVEVTPHFVGRDRAADMLVNDLVRCPRGSILICGRRGTGKTALVHHALAKAKTALNCSQRNWLIVPINAAQFEYHDDLPSDASSTEGRQSVVCPRQMIKAIIHRLAKCMPADAGDAKSRADDLCAKALASSWREETSNERSDESRSVDSVVQKILLKPEECLRALLPPLAGTTIASIGSLYVSNPLLKVITAAVTAIIITGLGMWAISVERARTDEQRRMTKKASAVASDNSRASLEYDLEEVHACIPENTHLVYVIDEMDKLDSKSVLDALRYFKQLITTSRALFVFIGDDTLYDTVTDAVGIQGQRLPWYTYFSNRYYIDRPRTLELLQYFDEIVAHRDMDDEHWDDLRRSLILESKNDFYDLKAMIRNRIIAFDADARPIMECPLSLDDFEKAKYQKSAAILLEPLYLAQNPLYWRDNDRLWSDLLGHLHTVMNARVDERFSNAPATTNSNRLRNDFFSLMYQLGRFKVDTETQSDRRSQDVDVKRWRVAGEISKPPDALGEPTEYERAFLGVVDHILAYALAMRNASAERRAQQTYDLNAFRQDSRQWHALQDLGSTYIGTLQGYLDVRADILAKNDPERREAHNREEVERLTVQARAILTSFTTHIPTLMAALIRRHFPQWPLRIASGVEPGHFNTPQLMPIARALANLSCATVFLDEAPQRIILLRDGSEEVQAIATSLPKLHETLRIIQVQQLRYPDVPKGVLRVRLLDDHRRFSEEIRDMLEAIESFVSSSPAIAKI